MPPTPLAMIFTATSSVESLFNASRSASALPCTSVLSRMGMLPTFCSSICANTSPIFEACFASFTSRNLPWRYSATSRALRSFSTARISSPAFGEPCRPSTCTGMDAEGLFDIGITGRDWVEETASNVVTLGELRYSKATSEPIKLVVAVAEDSPVTSVKELPAGVRVSTEYPELTGRYFIDHGITADVRLSYGASEAKVPDIADCVVEITETGQALRAAGLRIIDTVLVSYTEVIANPQSHADPDKRHAMGQLMTLLNGALDARAKVLVKLNVSADRYEAVLAVLPSAKSPTVSELAGGAGFAIESVVDKRTINLLIPALRDAGATDLLEIAISKIVS